MSRHFSRGALAMLGSIAFIAAVLAVLFSTGMLPATATARAEQLSQPKMPHALEGRVDCLLCHGATGIKPVPSSHIGRLVSSCLACHQSGEPATTKAAPAPKPAATPATAGDDPITAESGASKSSNEACLACHGTRGIKTKIGADDLSVYVDADAFATSVHGKQVACADCHSDKPSYPHEKPKAADARSYAVDSAKACLKCHQSIDNDYRDSVHGSAVYGGRTDSATCTDCHAAHAIRKSATLAYSDDACNKCHTSVVASYRDSVHGKLVASGRQDAAVCVDCHTRDASAHRLQAVALVDSVASGKNVADTCGKCHTKVAENYASTFHGKAMRLGVSGAAPTCVDCHGAYGIQRVHGPESPLTDAKIGQTCAKCHEGASENFAGGWIGHEEPSPSWFPIVFITERFLFYLTTTVVAFAVLHVELDLLRWFVSGRKKGKKEEEVNENGPQH